MPSAEALAIGILWGGGWGRERERERESEREREIVREREIQTDRQTERERERERERESLCQRERDGRHFTIVALKLAISYYTFSCQNLHFMSSPLKWRWVHAFDCQKNWHASFCLSQMVRPEWSKNRNTRSNVGLHCPSSHRKKKRIKLLPKTIGNRKRAWSRTQWINTTWENPQIAKDKSVGGDCPVSGTNTFVNCALWSADFLRWCSFPERNFTHNLFFYFQ